MTDEVLSMTYGRKDPGYPAITNKEFVTDEAFKNACIQADVEVTSRQASKWRNKKGAAYRAHKSKAVR